MLFVILFERVLTNLLLGSREAHASSLDEAALVALFAYSVFISVYRKTELGGFYRLLALLVVYLATVSLLFGRNQNVSDVMFQIALHLQYFMLLSSLTIIYFNGKLEAYKTLTLFILITVIGAVLQLVAPQLFSLVIGETNYLNNSQNFSVLRLEGLQKNPNALGVALATFIALNMIASSRLYSSKYIFSLFWISCLLLLATASRSSLIIIFIAFIFTPSSVWRKLIFLIVVMSALLISGDLNFVLEKTMENYQRFGGNVDPNAVIRWTLLKTGFNISVEYFPIGSGVATYGSAFAGDSVVYREQGISTLNAITSFRNIHDSNVGTILGELGLTGFLIFSSVTYYSLKIPMKVIRTKHSQHFQFRGLSLNKLVTMIIFIIFVTVFLRSFYASSYYATLVCLLYLGFLDLNRIQNRKRKSARN